MYPPPRPPHGDEEDYDRYPLETTRFNEQQPVLHQQSPFEDSYTVEEHAPPIPVYEDQPLLHNSQPIISPQISPSIPMPSPGHSPYSSVPTNEPYPQYPTADIGDNGQQPVYFTGAPRRQPRRYKTSKKCLFFLSLFFKKKLMNYSQKSQTN